MRPIGGKHLFDGFYGKEVMCIWVLLQGYVHIIVLVMDALNYDAYCYLWYK